MDEAKIKEVITISYKAGLKDGWSSLDTPNLRELDNKVNDIYLRIIMGMQEQMMEESDDKAGTLGK